MTGARIGSDLRQKYEIERGLRRDYSPGVTALDTALGGVGGFINFPGAGATARELGTYVGLNALEGGAINAASTPFYSAAEGEGFFPGWGAVGKNFGVGAVFGAGTAGVHAGISGRSRLPDIASLNSSPEFRQTSLLSIPEQMAIDRDFRPASFNDPRVPAELNLEGGGTIDTLPSSLTESVGYTPVTIFRQATQAHNEAAI